MMRRFAMFVVAAACGGSSKPAPEPVANTPAASVAAPKPVETCADLVVRARKAIDEIMTQATGHAPTDDDIKIMVDACNSPENKADRERLIACVNAAADDASVRACWLKPDPARDTAHVSEAALNLNKLAKNAKTIWISQGEFVKGTVGPTPAQRCCPKKCVNNPKDWETNPVWNELEFMLVEDTFYQYAYESDGKTFIATATADLDCDGKVGVWTLTGTGTPTGAEVRLTRPPKGVY